MNKCPYCGYRFEDEKALERHMDEGQGCPEQTTPGGANQ